MIGFTNIDGQGIEGIEKSFNAQLTGKPGSRLVRKDKFGHVIENITEVNPVPAHELQLSIDERLQTVTEDALDNAVIWNKAESGAAVLINIPTGEILSMASYPDFNPNNREGAQLDDFVTARLATLSNRFYCEAIGHYDCVTAGHRAAGQRYRYPSFYS
ncbi:penicillin-binding protein [Salmonella enterica subsp. enterica]|uniref:Penicillin-binding protein n=1 Tax=Salmonella enterica I TaxID=59201 RepID=A0A379W821_SALET|nr:penicillin-binding protein [Salmonella enterica subsp. enterica]